MGFLNVRQQCGMKNEGFIQSSYNLCRLLFFYNSVSISLDATYQMSECSSHEILNPFKVDTSSVFVVNFFQENIGNTFQKK